MGKYSKLQIPGKPVKETSYLFSRVTLAGHVWATYVYEGDKVRQRSLGTSDLKLAATRRDELFEKYMNGGATLRKTNRNAPAADKVKKNPDLYVYRRKPFYVKVKGKLVGYFETEKEALEARDAFLREDA